MSNEFYYNYSNKQFREKIRNCLRTCIKYGYKLKVTEYYQNSLSMEGLDIVKGVLKSFKLTHPIPDANWWKLKLMFNDTEREYEIENYDMVIEDIREINNKVKIVWIESGPSCYLEIKHIEGD